MARDRLSLDALGELAPRAHGVLSVDVAFALPFEDRGARRGRGPVKIGVNVSGLLFNEARSGRNRFGLEVNYADLMERFIADLVAKSEVEVHLIAHVTGSAPDWDDDGPVADQLARAFPAAIRAPNFGDPSAAKSYISGLDFLVAGRMHACIAAFSAGVPVTPVAYSRKFSGLFGMLDYPWMVPVEGVGTDEALAYLHDCVERRDELARDAARGMAKVEALMEAYRAELRRFLAAAVGAA
jgi:polysaccharide pyruvyl transferase WcaK-like protein